MENKLKQNLSYQTIYQILLVITPLIVTPYLSRILGSEKIGVYSFTYSIAYYFVMFAMLGLNNYGSRTIAIASDSIMKRSKIFWEIYSLQLLTASLMVIAYTIYSFFICSKEIIVTRLQLLNVIATIFDISWLYFGLEDIKPIIIKNTIIKLLSLIGVFTLIRSEEDIWIYASLLAGGQLFGCISMWFSLKGKVYYIRPNINRILNHFLPNLTLFIPVIAISVYKTMDKIMLGMISDSTQVGFYTNAETLINAPMSFIIAIGTVMLPRITNLIENKKYNESMIYFQKSLQIIMCFTCAVSFGIAAVSPVFVPLYYGESFHECIFLLEGQAIVMVFLAWANIVRTQFLLPNKHDKKYILSICFGAIINVILNMVLIPKFKAKGALIATIFAEGGVCFIQSLDANKYISMLTCLKKNIFFIITGIIMFLGVRFSAKYMEKSIFALILQIFIGILIYGILIGVIYFIFNKENKNK